MRLLRNPLSSSGSCRPARGVSLCTCICARAAWACENTARAQIVQAVGCSWISTCARRIAYSVPWRRCRHLRDAAQHRKQLIPQKEVQALVDAIELEPWLSYARPRKARWVSAVTGPQAAQTSAVWVARGTYARWRGILGAALGRSCSTPLAGRPLVVLGN
jgi:hypothetical protein